MPLWFIAAFLVIYGMGYFVFGFVEPPSFLRVLFQVPPIFPNNDTGKRLGRMGIGTLLMVVPLVFAYFAMRP